MSQIAAAGLSEFLRRSIDECRAPAVVTAVVDRDRLLFLDAAGVRDAAANAAIAADAIFRIASMTKPITSLAAMMLVDDGAVDVDAQASAYLPELEQLRVLTAFDDTTGQWDSRPPARPIAIRDLLTHTSGIVYPFLDSRLAKIDDGARARATVPLLHDPGERFTYGPGTAVLGSIVAAASGQSLDEFCRARIFEPLTMTDTAYDVPHEKRGRVVTVHTHDGNQFVERPNPAALQSTARGHDGLFSTATDYARFMQLFLNRGVVNGRRLVREATIDAMMSNQIGALRIGMQPAVPGAIASPFPIGGDKDTFGFGFQIETPGVTSPARRRSVGSVSWSGIFNTYFWIDPVKQIGVTVLMQFLPAHDSGALAILDGVERRVYESM
jgi:methyl acetate hydrolase